MASRWKNPWIYVTMFAIAAVMLGAWGVKEHQMRTAYRTAMDNQSRSSYYDMMNALSDVQVELTKLTAVSSPSLMSDLLMQTWSKADYIQQRLGAMPGNQNQLNETLKFVNQVSDYCYSLNKKVLSGQAISQQEMEQLAAFSANCQALMQSLYDMDGLISQNELTWGLLYERQMDGQSSNELVQTSFDSIEQTSAEYPSLIYDGAFSDSLDRRRPKELPEQMYDETAILEKAKEYLGGDAQVSVSGQVEGDLPAWTIKYSRQEREGTLEMTKQGAAVLRMTCDCTTQDTNLQLEECAQKASEFLAQRNYPETEMTYAQYSDGVAVLNMAPLQDDVLLYPDLIKVKVSMSDGVVIGIDAMNYVLNHAQRAIEQPAVDYAAAHSKVDSSMRIEHMRLVITPTPGGNEKMCWEALTQKDDREFLIYIDAATGTQSDVYQVMHTENGSFTL